MVTKLLVPFFSIHSRILERGSSFTIGNMKFLVAGTSPHKLGKVTAETLIRCKDSVEENHQIDYLEIIPMRRNQIQSRSGFVNTYVNPYLATLPPKKLFAFKHGVLDFENLRFLVRYSRPGFGYLGPGTTVRVEDHSKPLSFVRVAPIWKDERTCRQIMENFDDYEEDIRKNYLDTYFKSGLTRMVEKGETIHIENMEFFVNDCRPKVGYVNFETSFQIQTGFTEKTFKKKQIQADKNLAERIQQRDTHQDRRTRGGEEGVDLSDMQEREIRRLVRAQLQALEQYGENVEDISNTQILQEPMAFIHGDSHRL